MLKTADAANPSAQDAPFGASFSRREGNEIKLVLGYEDYLKGGRVKRSLVCTRLSRRSCGLWERRVLVRLGLSG